MKSSQNASFHYYGHDNMEFGGNHYTICTVEANSGVVNTTYTFNYDQCTQNKI